MLRCLRDASGGSASNQSCSSGPEPSTRSVPPDRGGRSANSAKNKQPTSGGPSQCQLRSVSVHGVEGSAGGPTSRPPHCLGYRQVPEPSNWSSAPVSRGDTIRPSAGLTD